MTYNVLFIFICLLSLNFNALAQDSLGEEVIRQYEQNIKEQRRREKIEREKEKRRNALEKSLNRTHKRISKSIYSVSDGIDEFFAGDRFQEEKNGSLIRFGYETLFREHHEPLHNLKFSSRLILPKTQERLNFLLQSIEEDIRTDEQTPGSSPNLRSAEEERKQNFFAGLRLRNLQSKEWSINTDAGVKLVWPPDPFARLRLRRSFFMSMWELRLTENIYWFESRGWSQVAAIDLERPVTPKNLIRFGNNGYLTEQVGYWLFNHYIGWFHQSSNQDALAYTAGITAAEEPAYQLESYYLSISYRKNVFEDWIFFDVSPTGSWPRQENFSFVPTLRLKLEVIFGGL